MTGVKNPWRVNDNNNSNDDSNNNRLCDLLTTQTLIEFNEYFFLVFGSQVIRFTSGKDMVLVHFIYIYINKCTYLHARKIIKKTHLFSWFVLILNTCIFPYKVINLIDHLLFITQHNIYIYIYIYIYNVIVWYIHGYNEHSISVKKHM